MIRLKSIHITGFKDPEEKKELVFSTEPITVIYGENGSGKTTFLNILFAILSRDEQTLLRENVLEVIVKYTNDNKEKSLRIKRDENSEILWDITNDLYDSSSILFGVYRGITEINLIQKPKKLKPEPLRRFYGGSRIKNNFLNNLKIHNHISTNFVQITDIQDAIINQYKEGQNIVSNKIKTAFFETIEKAIDIDEEEEDFILPDNFDKKVETNKDFILKAIPVENSSLTKRIKEYIETKDKSLTENSKIFRAMLLDMVAKAEEPNIELDSITKLIEIFNEHLYKHKKLIVTQEETYIDLGNGKRHELNDLSSGERNLLSILTLFLIIGKNRNFLMIDEPEISLNMKWQRSFLPLLSRLNSNAQIIVASHSPSIANNNSNYLVELV